MIEWSITATSTGTTLGLAGFTVDLVQSSSNPATIDTPPGSAVPTRLAGFSRPAWISNPSPDGIHPGYCGTPVGALGSRNLREIGGVQNTYGVVNPGLGTDINVESDIGVGSGGELLLAGSFRAPQALGGYQFFLENGFANVLAIVSSPSPSFAFDADVILAGGISFSVRCPADYDDGSGTGTPDGGVTIDDLLYYIPLFENGDLEADLDDGTGTGMPDGGVTIDDLLYFLVRFDQGC